MRSGMWILAVCGIVGLAWTAGTAEERLFEPSLSEQDVPSRYRRSADSHSEQAGRPAENNGSVPRVKNYHRELFGSEPPARQPNRAQTTRRPASFQSRIQRIEQIGQNEPARTGPDVPIRRIPVDFEPRRSDRAEPPPFVEQDRRRRIEQIGQNEPARTEPDVAIRRIPLDFEPRRSARAEPPPFVELDRRRRTETDSTPSSWTGPERPLFADSEPPANGRKPSSLSNILHAKHTQSGHASRDDRVRQIQAIKEDDSPFRTAEEPARIGEALPGIPRRAEKRPVLTEARPDSPFPAAVASVRSDAGASGVPMVSVRWVKRSDISVGQECRFDLIVQNEGRVAAKDVLVEAYFPQSVRLTSAKPVPAESQDHLSWSFASLAAGQEETIRISMIPSRPGELATKAIVRFTGSASGLFTVEEPLLKVTVQGPQEVMLGDPASQIVTVSNVGSGVAHNVQVETMIPAGLEHARGKQLVTEIGSLNPGESRKVRLALAAADGGEHQLLVEARASNALGQTAETRIAVSAPSIKLTIDGPGLRYKSRTARYKLAVTNDGSGATNNVRIVHKVPDGFNFLRADKGGKFDSVNKTVSWFIGRLDIGESAQVELELTATGLGDFVHQAGAFSEHAARTNAQLETRVEGTASLVLEIVDLDDPVEIGTETAYEVRVHNEGSKGANNVELSCELPPGVELIGVKGPAQHLVEKGMIVFKSLAELAPGKTAIYRIHVRGTTGGNHRFRARLASNSIQEPLVFEELTKFYRD